MRPQQRRAYYHEGRDTVDIAELYDVPEYVIYNNTEDSMGRPPGSTNVKRNSGHNKESKLRDEEPLFGDVERIRHRNEKDSKNYIDTLQEMGYKLKVKS
jgi:hypothetical protein